MDADGRHHRHSLADLVEQLHDQDELDELLAVYETGLHECMVYAGTARGAACVR